MILVVESDPGAAAMFVAAMGDENVHVESTRLAAARVLRRRYAWWSMIIVRAQLVDATWEDVLDDARAHNPRITALVVAEAIDDELVRRTFARCAALTCAPFSKRDLSRFARSRRLATPPLDNDEALALGLDRLSLRHSLKPKQERLLRLAIDGRTRREIAAELTLSENTVKTHIRGLLKRCGGKRMSDLAIAALRLALPPTSQAHTELANPDETESRTVQVRQSA